MDGLRLSNSTSSKNSSRFFARFSVRHHKENSMVNRKSLVFALCATASIIGLAGCSDDSGSSSEKPSGNESLVVNPTSVQLSKGQELPVTVLHSAASITATSNDVSCVTATVVNESTGVSKVNIKTAATQSCITSVEIKGDSKTESVAAAVVFGAPILNVSPQTINAKVGDAKRATAEYTKDGDALADKTLTLSLSSTDCVTLASNEVTTNDQGKAHIDITAGDTACETTLTITPPDKDVKAKTVEIKVTDDSTDTPIEVDGGTLEFYNLKPAAGPVKIQIEKGKTPKFMVRLLDGNSAPISSQTIIFTTSDNDNCISVVKQKDRTRDDGTVENSIETLVGGIDGCNATINISTSIPKVNTLVANVEVLPTTVYDMDVTMTLQSAKVAAKIGYAQAAFIPGQTCEQLDPMFDDWKDIIKKSGVRGEVNAENIDSSGDPLAKFDTFVEVDVTDGKSAVIGYASATNGSPILAYKCVDFDRMKPIVTLELDTLPIDLKGEYDVVSNFNLLSGFTKTKDFDTSAKNYKMPVAEKMVAGDWITWISALFNDPILALYNFIWVNSVDRLKGITDGEVKDVIDLVIKVGFNAGYDYLRPWLEGYLNSPVESSSYSWYEILRMVGPDVTDLVENMQVVGTMTYPSQQRVEDQYLYANANVNYTELHYQWSYIEKGKSAIEGCKGNAYAMPFDKNKNPRCRRALPLSDHSLTGTFNGSIKEIDSTQADGLLTIDPHDLNFKWASILFAAVFGTSGILDSAVKGYDVQKDKNGKDLYIGSFLSNLVFEPVIGAYKKKLESGTYDTQNKCYNIKDNEGKTVCWKELSQPNTKPCYQFIEATIYFVKPNISETLVASVVATGIEFAGDYVCEQGLSQLDTLVFRQLNKFQTSSESVFTLDSKGDCNIYSGGETSYVNIGKGDDLFTSAKAIIDGLKTNRCEWNLQLMKDQKNNGGTTTKEQATDVHIRGFFHATRKK